VRGLAAWVRVHGVGWTPEGCKFRNLGVRAALVAHGRARCFFAQPPVAMVTHVFREMLHSGERMQFSLVRLTLGWIALALE
jgi:hypothetical protein